MMFGLSKNVIAMGVVSFLNDVSSDMIFPFIPIFLTTTLGASATSLGLIEGVADSAASFMRIISGKISDKFKIRKPLIVFGYSLSTISKPLLAFSLNTWHVLIVRFFDRVGKGLREPPRDALLSLSCLPKSLGKVFGFHRGADTLGAALGPLIAVAILPFIDNDLRFLFLLSFGASFLAVLILCYFVTDTKLDKPSTDIKERVSPSLKIGPNYVLASDFSDHKFKFEFLGVSFTVFLIASTIFALGKASDAFLILRSQELGLQLMFLPIIYFVYNIVYALFSMPAGLLADKIGHRSTFMLGMLLFSLTYLWFAKTSSLPLLWLLFIVYGICNALTDGVGRAIVAGLVPVTSRASAYGMYSACTGIAILPASLIFGILWDRGGSALSFKYGAVLCFVALIVFLFLRTAKRQPL